MFRRQHPAGSVADGRSDGRHAHIAVCTIDPHSRLFALDTMQPGVAMAGAPALHNDPRATYETRDDARQP